MYERRVVRNPNFVAPQETKLFDSTAARWFTGAFEAGGVISFGIKRRRTGRQAGQVSSTVCIELHNNDEAFIDSLISEYEGLKGRDKGSWRWSLRGYRAANIVIGMEPYAVSRQESVLAMRNWLDSDTAERVRIAEEMRGYNRYLREGSVDEYEQLVKDPFFVAGVLDSRGTHSTRLRGKSFHSAITIRSKNKPLLHALQRENGGHVRTVFKSGDTMNIINQAAVAKNDSYSFMLSHLKAVTLIRFVSGYSKTLVTN